MLNAKHSKAIGHGLEGDFNRKKTSAFSTLLGERVAAPGVTVVDDGTLADRRGSITIDDEGTPSAHNVLIEDGILKGYMQDRMNARLMGVEKLLSPEQLQLGCQRLVDDVADLRLDNPRAPQLIAAFLTRCCDGLGLDASWRDAAARLGG